ncbi:unnamed protein product, partial [marine sediment metagenome]
MGFESGDAGAIVRLFLALAMAIKLATPALAQQPGETVEQGGSYAEPWFTDPTDITRNT